MRTFFAIDLLVDTREMVTDIIKQLKREKSLVNVKWTKPENLHITTRFLGNITNAQYEQIVNKVISVFNIEFFIINFTALALFPTREKPIAIILKPEPLAPLINLNQLLEQAVVNCDIKPEPRAFLPHLTLGKIKSKRIMELPTLKIPAITMPVNHITLFRSDTDRDGSHYTPLVCIRLKKSL